MRKQHGWALTALGGALLLTLVLGSPARSQRPPQPRELSLSASVAATSGVKEEDVLKVLRALGPNVADRLARGQTVELPGVGLIRTVRIPEHRDLVDGKPAVIAATNTCDFVPTQALVGAANAPGAAPAITVPAFQYNPLPNRTESLYTPGTRAPSSRFP
jgi:nucleoid DNA-binding protein